MRTVEVLLISMSLPNSAYWSDFLLIPDQLYVWLINGLHKFSASMQFNYLICQNTKASAEQLRVKHVTFLEFYTVYTVPKML